MYLSEHDPITYAASLTGPWMLYMSLRIYKGIAD